MSGEVRPAARPARVLYVDGSVGFGGAVKSLALTLRAMPGVDKRVITSQEPSIVREWLSAWPVRPFRRRMNYRTLGRLRETLARRTPIVRRVALKALALADLCVTAKNGVWMAWTIRRERISIVHLNNGFTPPEALLAARMTGTPCIVHLRDFHGDNGRSMRWAMRGVARVIAVSEAVAASLDGFLIPRSRIAIVHDPVDVDAIDRVRAGGDERRGEMRAAFGIPVDAVAVGMLGRVIPWKGQMEFARAALAAMADEPRLHAAIIGDESDGGRDYLDSVRALVDGSSFRHRFTFAGYRADVEACCAALDVVVHASVTPEPFGMVVPEAMAAGHAVIAADAGGPREVITHGVDGLRTPPGDVPALAAAILRLARDPALRTRLGEAAWRTARDRFRPETSAASVAEIYVAALAERGAIGTVPVEVSHA